MALAAIATGLAAQEGPQKEKREKFSPEKFDAELQEAIVKEANLTEKETAEFFPVYKEMQKKQRELFDRQRKMGRDKPQDEKGCADAIRERDEVELEMKKIQQEYHNRFLEVLPAQKVYDILKAEDRFHRNMLRKGGHDKGGRDGKLLEGGKHFKRPEGGKHFGRPDKGPHGKKLPIKE